MVIPAPFCHQGKSVNGIRINCTYYQELYNSLLIGSGEHNEKVARLEAARQMDQGLCLRCDERGKINESPNLTALMNTTLQKLADPLQITYR